MSEATRHDAEERNPERITIIQRRTPIMTLANLAAQAPSWYELLHRAGLERRRSAAIRTARSMGWLGLGLLAGGGIALLLAPRSGPETRERLGEKARRARDYVTPTDSHGSVHSSAANAAS
jgi:hypothetical protein